MCRNLEGVVHTIERALEVHVPLVVLAELHAGFACGRRGGENERVLERFLRRPGVRVLIPDEATTHAYASLYRQLRAQGTPIPTHDIWIASLALQHDLTLYDRDRHFDRLPQLRRIAGND